MQNKRKDGLAKNMEERVITKILTTRGRQHNWMIEKLNILQVLLGDTGFMYINILMH